MLALAIVLHAGAARAQRRGYIDGFVGWSQDGSFFVMTTAGTDEMDVPVLCLSRRGVPSPTWPKDVPVPDPDDPDGCTDRWDMMFPDNTLDAQHMVLKARQLVATPRHNGKGPHGEDYDLRRVRDGVIEVAISRGGKRVARGFFELRLPKDPVPDAYEAFWRGDGRAVAIAAGYVPAKDPGPGFGPPRYLVVIPLDGSTANAQAPPSHRQRAQALNVEGLKLLAAKNLDAAQQKFQAATQEDDSFALAYYNLACAASLRKDKQTALGALHHLSAVEDEDPVAKKSLAKGATDHDLDFIASDPEGAKLLKRGSPPKRMP
ncbi:MAG TPA: hypothetical protein VF516_29695 [Kofleriaceae bacterium]